MCGLLSRGHFLASQNRVIKQRCWRALPLVWGRESRAVFEGSGTNWHLHPALEGSLYLKEEPFLASCSLGSCPLPLSCSQCPGPPGRPVLQHMDGLGALSPSSSSKRRSARSLLLHAELDSVGKEGGNKRRVWLRFPKLIVSVC